MRKFWVLLGVVVLAAVGFLVFRGEEEPVVVEEPEEEIVLKEPVEEPEEEVVIELLENENLLTGLPTLSDEAIGLRPVAVMVSNVSGSMPQDGIGMADLIFEIPIEGGATRLMAMFGDMTQMPMVAPVRSARPYFPGIVQGFDILFAHYGNDPYITYDIEHFLDSNSRFDGAVNTGGLFGRDQGRISVGFAFENTAFFDGTRFQESAGNLNFRLELRDEHQGNFLFNPFGEVVTPDGESASSLHVNFRGTTADFTFDVETGLYLKDFNGNPHIDGVTGEQLAFTNVFVLETDIWVNWIGHSAFDFSGTGYYFSDGAVQPITWSKNERLQFFDEDGAEIRINRGKSYIAITHVGGTSFE